MNMSEIKPLEKKKYVLAKVKPIKIRVSPYGFYLYANDFFSAATLWKDLKRFSPVPYYLYCRSIELALKSFILCHDKNITTEKLKDKKKYGHDLIKCLNQAEKVFGKRLLEDKERENVEKANKYYKEKGFEYFRVIDFVCGRQNIPDLLILKQASSKLLNLLSSLKLVKYNFQ